jgi:hypothetical protein
VTWTSPFLALLIAACSSAVPTLTGTTCDDPDPTLPDALTWENFGHDFMFAYCTNCHSSTLPFPSQRNGAPIYHDFDTLIGVVDVAISPNDHIDAQAGWGPKAQNNFMPGGGTDGRCPSIPGGKLDEDCPQPTGEERTKLAQWVACERLRPH